MSEMSDKFTNPIFTEEDALQVLISHILYFAPDGFGNAAAALIQQTRIEGGFLLLSKQIEKFDETMHDLRDTDNFFDTMVDALRRGELKGDSAKGIRGIDIVWMGHLSKAKDTKFAQDAYLLTEAFLNMQSHFQGVLQNNGKHIYGAYANDNPDMQEKGFQHVTEAEKALINKTFQKVREEKLAKYLTFGQKINVWQRKLKEYEQHSAGIQKLS